MKFKTVTVSAPYEKNIKCPLDFPYLTFKGKNGVALTVRHDTSTLKGLRDELNNLHHYLNGECNKFGLALKDVHFELEWR